MEQVQFISTTPEQLQETILQDIRKEIENLKKDFQPKKPTEYLTRKQTAEMLKVDLSTLWNWVKKGKLTAYGIGHRVYFKRHEVEQALKPLNE